MKRLNRVSKQSMKYEGRDVNHSKVGHLKGWGSLACNNIFTCVQADMSDIDFHMLVRVHVHTIAL